MDIDFAPGLYRGQADADAGKGAWAGCDRIQVDISHGEVHGCQGSGNGGEKPRRIVFSGGVGLGTENGRIAQKRDTSARIAGIEG